MLVQGYACTGAGGVRVLMMRCACRAARLCVGGCIAYLRVVVSCCQLGIVGWLVRDLMYKMCIGSYRGIH